MVVARGRGVKKQGLEAWDLRLGLLRVQIDGPYPQAASHKPQAPATGMRVAGYFAVMTMVKLRRLVYHDGSRVVRPGERWRTE
jgi:hypothetical protein